MIIQRLTIHNIASIEDATINFAATPLSDSDVFLITGKTGAGKSTILDAICLALYANTPRMENNAMEGNIIEGNKSFKVDDTRQIMRRQTGEAFVSLSFIGSNGIPYEAEWAVARAHKKPQGSLQAKTWTWKNLHSGTTLTKDKEIESERMAAIGLDFKQFCRTTILAQGEFTRFLNSKDKDKATILEKITGVDVYSRIGAKIHEMTSERKAHYEQALLSTENIHVFSEEETAGKKAEIEHLDQLYDQAKQKKAQDETKRKWLQDSLMTEKSLRIAIEEYQHANQQLESEQHKTCEKLMAEWKQTIDAREWKRQVAVSMQEEDKQRHTLACQATQYQRLLDGILCIREEMAAMEKTINNTTLSLEKEQHRNVVYEKASAIISHLQSIMEGRMKMDDLQKRAAKDRKMIQGPLKEIIDQVREKLSSAQEAFTSAHNDLAENEQRLEEAQLPTLRKELEQWQQRLEKLKTAIESIDSLNHEKKRREEANKALDTLQETITSLEKEREKLTQAVHNTEVEHATWEKSLQLQRTTVDKWVKSIRLTLHEGDTCPVCRQQIHAALPHEDELDTLFQETQKAYDNIDKTLREQQQQLVQLTADIQSHQTLYGRNKKLFDQDKSLDIAEEKAIKASNACGIATISHETLALLDAERRQVKEKKLSVEATIGKCEQLESTVKALRKEVEKRRLATDTARKALEEAKETMVKYENDLHTIQQLMENEQARITDWEGEVHSILSNHEWENDWRKQPLAFIDELKRDIKSHQEQTKLLQETTLNLSNRSIAIDNVATTQDDIVAQMPTWRAMEGTTLHRENVRGLSFQDLQALANNIVANVKLCIDLMEKAGRERARNQSLLDQFLQDHPQIDHLRLTELSSLDIHDINRMERECKERLDAALSKRTQLEQLQHQKQEQERQKPPRDENDTIASLEEDIQKGELFMAETNEKKGGIAQQLRKDEENKQSLQQLLDECQRRKAIYDQWTRIDQLLGDAKGEKFKKIAQSYILGSLIHSANTYMKSLSDRYTLKVTPGTFIISIEDAYQGYVSRAASTISGGESFLVSLSLALALSDIGSRLAVNTLFIDEGFGTLSGEPLQNAIRTLHSLHDKSGRHVGIISHVEELRERIPVQIQVIQEGLSSNSIVKVVGV